jgi:hypothetical protein
LLLEAVVDVEDLLLRCSLAFTLSLLFALEVILVVFLGDFLGLLPLLVLFGALIWSTSFLHTETIHLLRKLLGLIVGE